MYTKYKKIHFIGAGGVGMYSLARLSLKAGKEISGSDISENFFTKDLKQRGASIHIRHDADNIKGCDMAVYSLSIGEDNPELAYAREQGIPTLTRAEFMAKLITPYKNRIAVSGSHGKSTVTAMLAHIFTSLGKSPTVICGAPLSDGLPIIIGKDEYLIYEACEYKDSFLKFTPTSVSVTNLELDHTDYFKSLEQIKESFLFSMNSAEKFTVINTDNENLLSLVSYIDTDTVSVGAYGSADFSYALSAFGDKISYTLKQNGKYIGTYKLKISGVFNVANAVLSIATAYGYGISPDLSAEALQDFCGISRRMELVGTHRGRSVFYDYAHHPTEITAVINALREHSERITVVFRPHTYTRTRDLWDGFVRALSAADFLIVTDIFAAREEPIDGITAENLAAAAGGMYFADKEVPRAIDLYTRGTVILMGAGELEGIKTKLLD